MITKIRTGCILHLMAASGPKPILVCVWKLVEMHGYMTKYVFGIAMVEAISHRKLLQVIGSGRNTMVFTWELFGTEQLSY